LTVSSRSIRENFICLFLRFRLHSVLSPSRNSHPPPALWRFALILVPFLGFLQACGPTFKHYEGVEESLRQGKPHRAVELVEQAEDSYDEDSYLLYLMDLGMTLHLAGEYEESNKYLEEADELVAEQYTKRLSDEATAILLNEGALPYRGDPYEQVMINAVKALNYALLQNLSDALVEARKIDHRLNVLSDSVDQDEYREDPFARYLTGVLYEASGDLNNAFIAYRKAEEGYRLAKPWSGVSLPDMLKQDILRMTKSLHLQEEHQHYRQTFPHTPDHDPLPSSMAQVFVVSYNGRGPTKEDNLIDVPLSFEALQLAAINKYGFGGGTRRTRGRDAILYGFQGQVVRVALPRSVPHPSQVAYSTVQAKQSGSHYETTTERVYDLGATAKKNLDDQFPTLMVRAAARGALKYGAAQGIGHGVRSSMKGNEGQLIGFLATAIATMVVIASEKADIRTWQTLPGEIQIGRLWLTPGEYTITMDSFDRQGEKLGTSTPHLLSLSKGETRFLTQRILD